MAPLSVLGRNKGGDRRQTGEARAQCLRCDEFQNGIAHACETKMTNAGTPNEGWARINRQRKVSECR